MDGQQPGHGQDTGERQPACGVANIRCKDNAHIRRRVYLSLVLLLIIFVMVRCEHRQQLTKSKDLQDSRIHREFIIFFVYKT